MPRWNRTDSITPEDDAELDKIVQKTRGMTRYGNRARTAIMMPVDVAKQVSFMAAQNGRTVSDVVITMIETVKVLRSGSPKQKIDEIMDEVKAAKVKSLIKSIKKELGDEYFMSIHIKKR